MAKVPSVGRVVHYVAYGTPGGEFPVGACRAGIVTEVDEPDNPESPIGVCVLNPTGIYFNQHLPYNTAQAAGSWHWPEYVPDQP
jgi:hypothetical protein